MKILIFTLLIATTYADKADTMFKELDLNTDLEKQAAVITAKCLKETKVDPELIKITEDNIFPEDQNLKCYYGCLALNFGNMYANGDFNMEKSLAVTSGVVREIAVECVNQVTSNDLCKRAYDAYKCIRHALLQNAQAN